MTIATTLRSHLVSYDNDYLVEGPYKLIAGPGDRPISLVQIGSTPYAEHLQIVKCYVASIQEKVTNEELVPQDSPFDRSTEMRWFESHSKELERSYPDEWLAIEDEHLISHGARLVDVLNEARTKGVDNPFIVGTRPAHFKDVDTVA